MTISVKHSFISPKSDGTDSTLIQPSNWNADHTITLNAGKVLGRFSGTAGAAQELPIAVDAAGQSLIPPKGSTAERPASPVAGMMRYNTTINRFEGYGGSAWGTIGGGGTISDTAPSAPTAGDFWWNSTDGQLYIYYTDPDSSQWVVANAFTNPTAYLKLTGGTMTGNLAVSANVSYTGTLTGGTGVVNIGGGQFYKDASGNVGIGTASPGSTLTVVGTIESTSGGVKFPDGTTQTTKAVGITLGTSVASTSGTSIDFTGIPSNAKRVTVMVQSLSTSGSATPCLRLGTSSGVETTGYAGVTIGIGGTALSSTNNTTYIGFDGGEASTAVRHGMVVLTLLDSNTWTVLGSIGMSSGPRCSLVQYSKALSGTLDRIRLTTSNGSDTFDAGTVNISWEV